MSAIERCMPLVSFAAALVVIGWLVRSRWARIALDHPNRRSLHKTPTPRIGGIGVLTGVGIALAALGAEQMRLLWPGLALLAIVSFLDDVRGVPVSVRFAAHLMASTLL